MAKQMSQHLQHEIAGQEEAITLDDEVSAEFSTSNINAYITLKF